jgi:hypothetical protein
VTKEEELPHGLETFTQGATYYFDHYGDDDLARLVLNVYLADQPEAVSAIVDTATPWCVLKPTLLAEIVDKTEPIRPLNRPLNIRGIIYTGWLYRVPMRLEAIF